MDDRTRGDIILKLVKSRYPHEVREAIEQVCGNSHEIDPVLITEITIVVGAALKDSVALGRSQGIREARRRVLDTLGLNTL